MTAIEELLAAVDALDGHGEFCDQRRDPFADCDCGTARLVGAAARVRAELARGEMSDEELLRIGADGFAAGIKTRAGRLSGLRAVERVVRARRP